MKVRIGLLYRITVKATASGCHGQQVIHVVADSFEDACKKTMEWIETDTNSLQFKIQSVELVSAGVI